MEGLQVAEQAKFLLDLTEYAVRELAEPSAEAPVVDRPVLVDHDLAIRRVAGDPLWEGDAEEVISDEPGGARQDPGRRVAGRVQEVGLDHHHRTDLAGFRTASRAQVGRVEATMLHPRGQSSPSPARWSSSSSSARVEARAVVEARR